MPKEPAKFRNYYRCDHKDSLEEGKPARQWHCNWSCCCNDRCPTCNHEVEPYRSEELCLECGVVVDSATDGKCPKCGEPIKDLDELQDELADVDVSGHRLGVGLVPCRYCGSASCDFDCDESQAGGFDKRP